MLDSTSPFKLLSLPFNSHATNHAAARPAVCPQLKTSRVASAPKRAPAAVARRQSTAVASFAAAAGGAMPLSSSSTSCSSVSTSSSPSPSSTSTASPAAPPAAPILALAVAAVSSLRNGIARALSSAFAGLKQRPSSMTAEEKRHADDLVKRHVRSMRTLAAVAPLASITSTGSEHVLLLLTRSVASFIKLYLLFLFMRVLLSWFPAFNWDRQPWLTLRQLTDPYLNVFRGIIPPFFGMIDFTPLLGFFVLQWVQSLLETISAADSDAEGGFSSADDSPF